MLLISCLAVSAVSAADIEDTNDIIASDASDVELEAINDADIYIYLITPILLN